jgi:hypothetical protein
MNTSLWCDKCVVVICCTHPKRGAKLLGRQHRSYSTLDKGEKIAKYNLHAHLSFTHQLPKMVKVFLWRQIGPLHLNSFAGNVIQVWISQSKLYTASFLSRLLCCFGLLFFYSFVNFKSLLLFTHQVEKANMRRRYIVHGLQHQLSWEYKTASLGVWGSCLVRVLGSNAPYLCQWFLPLRSICWAMRIRSLSHRTQ